MAKDCFRIWAVLGVVLVVAGAALGQQAKRAKQPAFEQIEDDPRLPRVLLIGDSISIGYTVAVRDELKGTANVHRPATNCSGTKAGLEKIDEWLGDRKWDVIHFNWGLHDLKYVDSQNRLTTTDKGTQQSALPVYRENLAKLTERLEKTGATLIFATTTPIPKGSQGRVVGDEDKYNAAAVALMKARNIRVNDLCAFVRKLPEECKREANVHYTQSGSQRLGQEVAKVIADVLAKR